MQTLLEVVLSNALVATLLALLAAGLSALCRRPALTHCLWLLVLLKLVTPAVVPVHLPWSVAPEPAGAAPVPRVDVPGVAAIDQGPVLTPAPEVERDEAPADAAEEAVLSDPPPAAAPAPAPAAPSWTDYLVPLWLLTALFWLGWNGFHLLRFRRLLQYAVPAPPALQEQARELAWQLGLRRCPPVLLVPGALPPMVWGLGPRPRLLFPAALLDRLDEGQRASLLLHELAHVRRRDHWVRLLELAVVPLYWWHPVVWWARRELHEAEEQCCDAWVVWALAGSGRTYAVALLQALAFCAKVRSPLPAAASGTGEVPHLRRRLTMIMRGKTPRALPWAGAVAVLGVGLLLLPLRPVAGQVPPPPPPGQPPAADPADDADDLKLDKIKRLIEITGDDVAGQKLDKIKRLMEVLDDKQLADKIQKAVRRQVEVRVEVGDGADLKKAAAELKDLAKEVAQKRKELAQAEARLARAKARMDRMKKAAESDAAKPAPPSNLRVVPGTPRAPRGDRLDALEQRLDRILREVDALRKELHRERGSDRDAPAPPRRPVPPKPPAPPEDLAPERPEAPAPPAPPPPPPEKP
jgi:beta-lactamase regulating signal transducer with metallopeptidase domain